MIIYSNVLLLSNSSIIGITCLEILFTQICNILRIIPPEDRYKEPPFQEDIIID